jgi:arylsulfatase A-like enzyme
VDWHDVDLPEGYIEDASLRESVLRDKPRHWSKWYEGEVVSNYEAPAKWVPATMTADQVREVNALNAIEVELVDEAIGRVLDAVGRLGFAERTDVIVTTDHGELQGDFGLLFKGPYHTDALLRLPLIWRPAPCAATAPSVVAEPVGLVNLAPTFLSIAGVPVPEWMEATSLPATDDEATQRGFDAAITEWDSALFGIDVHLRTVVADGWLLTRCDAGTLHDGTEGELYDLGSDPLQRANRFDDPAVADVRRDLLDRLAAHDAREVPGAVQPGLLVAPV